MQIHCLKGLKQTNKQTKQPPSQRDASRSSLEYSLVNFWEPKSAALMIIQNFYNTNSN